MVPRELSDEGDMEIRGGPGAGAGEGEGGRKGAGISFLVKYSV